MFKKLKKHKLSLFLLAMVCMLSVYYIMMPNDKDPTLPVGDTGTGDTRYQEFAEMRLEIIDERNEQVAAYEAKIVDATVSIDDKNEYVLEIQTLQTLTEKEVYVEGVIMNLGYEDCLVYLSADALHISVLAEKFEVSDYIEVALLAKEEFGKNTLVKVSLVLSS